MANKFTDFIKKNAAQNASGMGGVLLGASAIASIASGESALKVFGNTLKEVIFGMASFKLVGASMFFGVGKGIRSLVSDTGSLQEAIDKLKKIQGLHKLFEPLVGGAKAAKLEVAKLVNFSSSKGLKLDDVAQGARNLKILTRDAYSGTEALSAIADAAAGTGSSVSDMANAVGQFSATLRSGGSITGASEQLRQMGVISQSTADSMTRLQDNGASSTQVFSVLTAALGTFAGGAEKSKGSIAGVNAAYDSAISSLQQKFGSPFVESDIQNTKNWTDALTAIAPVVESLSGFLNILFGGMSTLGSWLAKTTAESSTMRTAVGVLVKGLALLVTVVSAVSAVSLAAWLLAASSGMVLFTGSTMLATVATRALGLAIAATGIGLLLVLVGTAVGVFMQYSSSMDEAKKAQEDLNTAHKEAMDLLQKQIDAIKTLADQHDALAAAIANSAKAQENLNKAKMDGDPKAIADAKEKLEQANAKVTEVANIDKTKLEGTAIARKQTVDMVTRQRQEEERKHNEEMESASPERKIELLKERAAKINKRAELAKIGDEASKKAADERATADQRKLLADAKVDGLKKDSEEAYKRNKKIQDDQGDFFKFGEGDAQGQKRALQEQQMANIDLPAALREQKDAEQAQKDIGKNAPEGTYERLRHDANSAQESGDIPKAEQLRIQAERALQDQQARGADEAAAKDADAAVKAALEQQAAAKIQLETETAIANLKTEGYERAQDELDLALKRIEAERALEKDKGEGYTSQAKLDKLDNEKKNTERQKEINRREQEKSVARDASEARLSSSSKRGYSAQDEARDEKLKLLRDQYNAQDNTLEGIREKGRLQTEMNNLGKSSADSAEAREQSKFGTQMELDRQNANITGDSDKAEEIERFSVFKDKYDSLLAETGDKDYAKATAEQFASNAISLDATKASTNFNSSIAADSLARIGGGGNVAAGESPELNVAKQSQKLLENIDKYIFRLYEERSKRELTAL